MVNKFNFYEIVEIKSSQSEHLKINGKTGVIMGMAQNENGYWGYAVDINNDGWSVEEKYLVTTGKFFKREDFYNEGDKIKVIVNNKGEGELK